VSEPRRYKHSVTKDGTDSLLFDPAFDAPTTLAPMGEYVRYEDYSKLKEEAERYRLASLRVDVSELHAQFNRALFDDTIAENARLKAEVDRLTAFTTCTIIPNEELKAKLERLTQAGNNLVYVASEHPVAETFVQAWWKEVSHD
jgi:hypothetical protein